MIIAQRGDRLADQRDAAESRFLAYDGLDRL